MGASVAEEDGRVVVLAPLILWAVALLLVPPSGEFPLNDDWIYSRAVLDWLDTGTYGGHPFSTATLVAQAGWGALFSLVFGFSFEVLRWSTLFLWAVAAVTTGQMARVLGADRWAASLAGCLIIANPLALNLGYTFMTDVPFLALMTLSAYGYLRFPAVQSLRWLVWGSCFGALAFLVRQFAPVVLLAFLVANLPHWRALRVDRTMGIRVLVLLVPWLVAWGGYALLPRQAEALGHTWIPEYLGETRWLQVFGAAKFYVVALAYLALFTAPLLVAAAWAWYRDETGCWKRRTLWTGAIGMTLGVVSVAYAPRRMPYLGNILFDAGLGPRTLRSGADATGIGMPPVWGDGWWLLTIPALTGGAWLLLRALVWLRDWVAGAAGSVAHRRILFLGLWAALSVVALYHPLLPVRFDRYLLGALVPVLVLLSSTARMPQLGLRIFQGVCALAFFAFSVAAQHDYLAWNHARWRALDGLLKENVPPESIDGGYEFNGWYTSPHFIKVLGADAFIDAGPLGWWVVDDTYAIAWQERPGYVVREEVPYGTWLGRDQRLLVLERE